MSERKWPVDGVGRDELEEKLRWRKVEDEKPEKRGLYRVNSATGYMVNAYWTGKQWAYDCAEMTSATHWMPLPEGPGGE